MSYMSDFKQVRKSNICFEVTVKCIDTVLSFWGFIIIIYILLIHQNLGTSFDVPKSSYRSQKQPVLSPAITEFSLLDEWGKSSQ